MNRKRYIPEPASAPGDFYNVQDECVSCGVPHAVAPDLVGWVDDVRQMNCYWIKQPETPGEFERAYRIFDGQEVGCHRYAGTDPLVQIRIGSGSCDNPVGMIGEKLFSMKQAGRSLGKLFSEQWGRFATESREVPTPDSLWRRVWQRLAGRR